MNATETRIYRKDRREGLPARIALDHARYVAADDVFDWNDHGTRGTCKRDGFELVATVQPDLDTDTSWLGVFVDEPQAGAVRNPSGTRDVYQWFVPTYKLHERARDLNAVGYSKGVAYETAAAQVQRDAWLARELYEYVIVVRAFREDIELGSASVGGVDFDDDTTEARRYADEVATELGEQAVEEARAALARLCA